MIRYSGTKITGVPWSALDNRDYERRRHEEECFTGRKFRRSKRCKPAPQQNENVGVRGIPKATRVTRNEPTSETN
jgi:hypothetical protein